MCEAKDSSVDGFDVVLPRHTIVGVTEYHRRDGFPHADSLKVRCEAAPEAVPAFPLDPCRLERLFHLAMVKAVQVHSLTHAVSEDRAGCWTPTRFPMPLEQGFELWYERHRLLRA